MTILSLPKHSRPREKMLALGASVLSDVELLAILLGTGAKGKSVLSLAHDILKIIDQKNGTLSIKDLLLVHGLGKAKSCIILAAHEFTRRRIRPHGIKIQKAPDVLPLVSHLSERHQEHFIAISLNGAHEVIASRVITIGLVNTTQIHPREVFSEAITDRASALIVAHNHPSGNLNPSDDDRRTTVQLKSAGELLGIPLIDHIVFSRNGYFSFKEQGVIL